MQRSLRIVALAAVMATGMSQTARAQETHVVRLEADSDKDEYGFRPAAVTARPGDVIVFRLTNGAPHSVVFEGAGLTRQGREALNAAMPRRAGDLSSPLLTENGTEYRMTVPSLPAGTYGFFCLPHRAYDMRGELRIE